VKKSISALHSRERERSQCSNQSRGFRASSQNPENTIRVKNHSQSFTDFELKAPLRNVKLALSNGLEAANEAKLAATASKNHREGINHDLGLANTRRTLTRNNLMPEPEIQPHALRHEASVEKIQHIELKRKVHHSRVEPAHCVRPDQSKRDPIKGKEPKDQPQRPL
jgi:hypothetical protein